MYSVSVIMPVYNNEKTLIRAIESILNQTVFDLELILVNDGSTDASAQICEVYAKKEPLFVEVIHQERMGLGPARNKGLLNSTGEFVYFADPNHTFDRNLLAENIQLAKEKDAELVVFGFTNKDKNSIEGHQHHLPRIPHLLDQETFRNHYRNFHHFYPYELSNKIYRRDYLKKHRVRFYKTATNEAAIFNISIYKTLSRVVFNRRSYCMHDTRDLKQASVYDESIYPLNVELAQYFESVMKDWAYENIYEDLIISEYYRAVHLEVENICHHSEQLTPTAQARKINTILTDEKMRHYLDKVKLSDQKTPYKKALLATLQNGNSKAVIRLVTGKNGTQEARSKLSRLIRNVFNG